MFRKQFMEEIFMKKLKARVCLALTLVLMLSMILPGTANAAVISDHPLSESERRELERQPTPYIYTPCTGGNGICQLYPKGWAYTYDENNKIVSRDRKSTRLNSSHLA